MVPLFVLLVAIKLPARRVPSAWRTATVPAVPFASGIKPRRRSASRPEPEPSLFEFHIVPPLKVMVELVILRRVVPRLVSLIENVLLSETIYQFLSELSLSCSWMIGAALRIRRSPPLMLVLDEKVFPVIVEGRR